MSRVLLRTGVALGLVALIHVLAPAWVEILAGIGAATTWALWATRPANEAISSHVARRLGELILRVVTGALSRALTVVLLVLLVVASWSFIGPRFEHWRAQEVAQVKDAATPDVPSVDVGGWLKKIREGSDR